MATPSKEVVSAVNAVFNTWNKAMRSYGLSHSSHPTLHYPLSPLLPVPVLLICLSPPSLQTWSC